MRTLLAALFIAFASPAFAQCAAGYTTVPVPLCQQNFVPAPAFYVSTTGNDSNAGTLAAPFATLHQCKLAMEGSSTKKTCYIRAGSYTPAAADASICGGTTTCAVSLGSASDNGQTWSYYPPDGVNSADISGGSTSSTTGLFDVFFIFNSTGVTINGLKIHNFEYAGIHSGGGNHTATIINNEVYNGFCAGTTGNCTGHANASGIVCYGCVNAAVKNNYVHDIASFGIAFTNVNGDISNLSIDNNVVKNACTGLADCGAVYVQDTAATATNISITNNYIHDGAVTGGTNLGSAIYLDDCTSNATVAGNVVAGNSGGNTLHLHGGSYNVFDDNLIDLSTGGKKALALQTSSGSGCSAGTMSGNHFEHNILISGGGGGGFNVLSGSPVNAPTIANNDYWNYAGSAISHTGSYTDTSPQSQDPKLTCWTYRIDPTSAVLGSPVSFTGLPNAWGPPGFAIPHTGTVPSSPHTC